MVCRGQKIIPDGCFEDVVVSEKLKSHPCGGVVVAGSFPFVPVLLGFRIVNNIQTEC